MRVSARRLKLEQVDHVYETDLQIGTLLAKNGGRGKSLHGYDIAGTGYHCVGLAAFVVARPRPDADAFFAVFDRRVHIEILQMGLLVSDDHIHVVNAPQTMVSRAQQAIHVRGQVNAGYRRTLVRHDVQKTRILMREAVVVLAPNGGGDEKIERRY